MRKAIVQPIVQAGGEIVSPLVDRMLNDLDGRTDQLPVMQHALMRMWNRRTPGQPLSAQDYADVGGFTECLSNHAGKVFEDLPKDQQAVAIAMFKAITETTPDNRQVRRQSTAAAVARATGKSIDALRLMAEAFSDGGTGFVIVSPKPLAANSTVDISHEALIRQWSLLRGWVEEEAGIRRAADRLDGAADEWKQKSAKDPKEAADYLYRGGSLQSAEEIVKRPDFQPSPATAEFLAASRKAERRSLLKRRMKWSGVGLVALLLLVIMAEFRVTVARHQAEEAVQKLDRFQAGTDMVQRACGEGSGADPICADLREATLSKRVFLHIPSETRRDAAKLCQDKLVEAGFGVHGIQLVETVPDVTSVRYFAPGDHIQADEIAGRLATCGEPGAKVVKLDDPKAGPGLIEIWFRPVALKLETRVNSKDGLTYARIPKGSGTLRCPPGASGCQPRPVEISQPFWMGVTEVTQAAFEKVKGSNPSQVRDPALPVDSVTWDEAVSYCGAAGGRLPTEAEWEYAARAGSNAARYGPIDSVAWYGASSGGSPHPVGGKLKNGFGLQDMLGNLWEWTADAYVQPFTQQDASKPVKYRTLRGGAWNSDTNFVHLSVKLGTFPAAHRNDFGFRCVAGTLP